ncbi:hemolymph lipopolysaccharide-binding protein-like [Periplaneta americana]|uniref:hemolymph lipopolysaccharide-binding protein-like n=1 Tax=Periplaneta americana TaxID=6978 RepID=UPI0037E74D6B
MLKCVVVCCVLVCIGELSGLQCVSRHTSAFKFSIVSRRNQTGNWIAEVELGHEGGLKEAGPWAVDVDHTTRKCEDSESILIAAILKGPASFEGKASLPKGALVPKGPPSAGYELLSGLGYYKMHTEPTTWHEALNICTQEGAHLLVVNSEFEANAMAPLWKNASENWAFSGFHDQYKDGEYVTIFNEPLKTAGFSKWSDSSPQSGNYKCGLFGKNLMLADNPCSMKRMFICELEL